MAIDDEEEDIEEPADVEDDVIDEEDLDVLGESVALP